jgi:hypothetical protein
MKWASSSKPLMTARRAMNAGNCPSLRNALALDFARRAIGLTIHTGLSAAFFQFEKCGQLFIGLHNVTLAIVAVGISAKDRAAFVVALLRAAPRSAFGARQSEIALVGEIR